MKTMQLLKSPDTYRPGTYGGWRLKIEQPAKKLSSIRSYYSGLVEPPKESPTLYDKGGTLWMSITPCESESQYRHNEHAVGHVVVMGAGLGLLPYNLLLNPKVKTVTIIEKDRDMFDHWAEIVGLGKWPNWVGRVSIVHDDARTWTGTCDTLIADIWPNIGDEKLEEDMDKFRANVKFKRMMCWGAEFSFISWCMRNGLGMYTTTQCHAKTWGKEYGHYIWPGFTKDASNAAVTSVLPTGLHRR